MITVFYDGKCGLCSKEIRYYQRIAPTGVFDWVDITKSTEKLDAAGIPLVDALRSIYSIDHNDTVHTGVDTFLLIWRELKYWKLLGTLVSLPIIRQATDLGYIVFAKWRFNRYTHCKVALDDQV